MIALTEKKLTPLLLVLFIICDAYAMLSINLFLAVVYWFWWAPLLNKIVRGTSKEQSFKAVTKKEGGRFASML